MCFPNPPRQIAKSPLLFDYFFKSALPNCKFHIAQLSSTCCQVCNLELPTPNCQIVLSPLHPCELSQWASNCPQMFFMYGLPIAWISFHGLPTRLHPPPLCLLLSLYFVFTWWIFEEREREPCHKFKLHSKSIVWTYLEQFEKFQVQISWFRCILFYDWYGVEVLLIE